MRCDEKCKSVKLRDFFCYFHAYSEIYKWRIDVRLLSDERDDLLHVFDVAVAVAAAVRETLGVD